MIFEDKIAYGGTATSKHGNGERVTDFLRVGSAVEDRGADPVSEFLTTLHASCAWELFGKKGLITPDKLPEIGDHIIEGNIGYHLRAGRLFFSREDWNHYIKFLKTKL